MKPALPPDEIVRRIKKALARDGMYSWQDLCDRLHDHTAQIFWNDHGAWVTELVKAPQKRALHVWIVAGELPEVMELQDKVCDFARQMNCSHVYATGRKGWKYVARAHGWKEEAVVISHPL